MALARRPIGRMGQTVTTLGLGGAPLSGFRANISERQGVDTLLAAYAAGVRYFDTAPYYGYGRSELIFGQALRTLDRDSFVVSTKVGRRLSPKADDDAVPGWRRGGLPFKPTFDYGREGTLRSLEQSLLRLGLNRIDIVLIHDVDVWTHGTQEAADQRFRETMAGCFPALAELRAAGVIKAIGVGLNESDMSLRFVREADLDCVMLAGRYTLLEQGALDDLLPECERKGVSILLAGPLNSGILATGAVPGATYNYQPAPPPIMERVGRLEAACRRHGVELATAALQFPLAHPCVKSIVAGAVHPGEVNQNVARMSAPIPPALWAELKQENLIAASAPVPG
ncbi:MAG: aldo/keto reductase [Alphaproteobacteria bacterium]